jgi:hypothetical protein
MSIRHVARTVAATAASAAAAGGIAALAMASPAGAVLSNGSQVPGSASPTAPFTPGIPFSSGQTIDVIVPANSVLTPGALIRIVECAAPNGVLPTSNLQCDGNTIQGQSETVGTNGGFDLITDTGLGYPIYSLPNVALGEAPNAQPVCGNTVATECVLYIGQDQLDFTKPHFFSQVFLTNATAGNTGANPGDGTPEVPLAVGLPLAAMGVLGGTILYRRRRASNAA